MVPGGPMKGISYGVFNYTHSNFSLYRRNYKFHQKEIVSQKNEKYLRILAMNRCFSLINGLRNT